MNDLFSNNGFNQENNSNKLSNDQIDQQFNNLLQNISLEEEIPLEEYSEPEHDESTPYNAPIEKQKYYLDKNFLNGMNPEQQEAVLYDQGSLLVLAGAGSGKTRVITHRFAHLVQKYDLGIHNILCVTFTNKAAGEMKERISSLLGVSMRTAWVRTFHSMCAMILREYAYRIGFSQDFTIYDASDTRNTIKKIMDKLDIDSQEYPIKAILRTISSAKEELISPELFGKSTRNAFDIACAEIYIEYQTVLKQNQAMDFGDLIANTICLIEQCPDIQEHYQRQWRFIMADEFQDTNKPQYHLLSLLSKNKKNVCVVGDDDQSIYAWRGARVENIRQFQKEFQAHIIRLERNYRSYGNILIAANSVVKSIKGRMPKTLKAEREQGEKIIFACLGDDRLQASFLYEEIQKLVDQGNEYHDIAILYRTNAQSRVIEEVMTRHRIPHKIYGGQRFFDRAEIKDILSYLRIIVNPYDIEAFERIVNIPKRKIGDVGKKRIQEFVETNQITFPLACIQANKINGMGKVSIEKLVDLGKILEELKESSSTIQPTKIIKILIESIRYFEDYLVPRYGNYEAEDRFKNIQELVNAVKIFEQANPNATIADFLREASLLSSLSEEDIDNSNMISLMTIHSSKGLEFPIVFVIGIAEGVLPLASSQTQEALDEEKRLFYVATTRAMNKLYLTYEQKSLKYGEFVYNEQSHFIDAIPSEILDKRKNKSETYHLQKDNYRQKSTRTTYKDKQYHYSNYQSAEKAIPQKVENKLIQKAFQADTQNIKTEKINSLSEIQVGQDVVHIVFGKGKVEYVSNAMVKIIFDQFGTQVLMGSATKNLKKIINN